MRLNKFLFKAKKGVSPLLATIILIAITVAAGLVIYNLFFSTAGTVSSATQVDMISCDLTKAGSKVLLSITVKNTGNKPLTSCTVTLWDGSSPPAQKGPFNLQKGGADVLPSNQLEPGAFASVTKTEADVGTNFVLGNKYPIKVDATAADGSTFSKSFTVTCTG